MTPLSARQATVVHRFAAPHHSSDGVVCKQMHTFASLYKNLNDQETNKLTHGDIVQAIRHFFFCSKSKISRVGSRTAARRAYKGKGCREQHQVKSIARCAAFATAVARIYRLLPSHRNARVAMSSQRPTSSLSKPRTASSPFTPLGRPASAPVGARPAARSFGPGPDGLINGIRPLANPTGK